MNEKSINITLPLPTSINKAYKNSPKWRVKTEDYKNYYKTVLYSLMKFKYEIEWDLWLFCDYEFHFNLYNKNWTKKIRDLWNLEKTLTDSLCNAIPWLFDHNIKEFRLTKVDDKEEFVRVIIYEL